MKFVLGLAGFFLLLLVGSCRKPMEVPVVRAAKAGLHAYTYGGTYRMNMLRGSPAGLDPVTISSKVADDIALNIYDRLITFDTMLTVQPELAKRWEIRDDGLLYTFHIRNDAYFHNDPCFPKAIGRRLVANDVAISLGRACDPRTKTVAFWAFKNRVVGANEFYDACKANTIPPLKWPTGITVVNDSTLTIALHEPFSPFLQTLANGFGCVVPFEAIEAYGAEFTRHPVGSGAFSFASWIEDRSLVLKRSTRYWDVDEAGNRLPYLDRVEYSFIQDDGQQYMSFDQGELEECFTIPTEVFPSIASHVGSVVNLKNNPKGRILQYKQAWCTWFVDFLCSKQPFNNVHVRRAFSLAIDRHRLCQYVLAGTPASPAEQGVVPTLGLPSSVHGIAFNPEAARKELALSGYSAQQLQGLVFTIYQEPRLKHVAEALQRMWSEHLGVDVSIEIVRFAQFLSMSDEGKFQMWGTRWYGDYPDPETFLTLFNGSLIPEDPLEASYPNNTRINDTYATQLIESGVREPDEQKRLDYYIQAQQRLTDVAPAALLFYDMHYRLLQPWVRGYTLDPMARFVLKRTWFDTRSSASQKT